MLFFSPDLLRRLRAWADAHGVYLIADEIAAGMGRLGAILASHLVDGPGRISAAALPDFAVLSKGLTAGVLPLSAVLTTDAIYDLFVADYADGRAFLHSNTFTGNALAVAVALAVLDVFADDDMLGRVSAGAARVVAALQTIAAERPYLRNVRACGMVAAVDIRDARRPAAGPGAPYGMARLPRGGPTGRAAAPAGRHDVPVSPADHDRRRARRDGRDPGRQPGCNISPSVSRIRRAGGPRLVGRRSRARLQSG